MDLKPNKLFLASLLGIYTVLMFILAINPIDRQTWLVENFTVWIFVISFIILYIKNIRFSNISYALASVFIFLHTIGGHYTFALVPFDYVTNLFDFSRNHFDRIAHYSIGFYAFLIAEWIAYKNVTVNKFVSITYPIFAIATLAAFYECVEWIYAATSNSSLGIAYLGSQGDIWDAQKDMLADTLGAITVVILFLIIRKRNSNN